MRINKGKGRNRNLNIRTDLIADRENQKSYAERIDRDSFGIYRTVRPESVEKIKRVMEVSRPAIHSYLAKERPNGQFANIRLPESWRVTFVQEQKVRTAMRHGSIARTIETGIMLRDIETHTDTRNTVLPVPIARFDWMRHGERRKFAGLIDDGDALAELCSQASAIDQLLLDVSGEGIYVEDPDHITFGTYGKRRDGLQLSIAQRKEVGGIISREFAEQEVGHILLGGIHSGKDLMGEGVNG